MIIDLLRLREVIEEIAEWNLQDRRWYIAEMEKAFGTASAEQIRNGLTQFWKERQ